MSAISQPQNFDVGIHSVVQASPSYASAVFAPMCEDDLAEVEVIEKSLYDFPWTVGNFKDSLASGYECWIARSATNTGVLLGYFLMMLSPGESHLLNITVVSAYQGQGFGRQLLTYAATIARAHQALAMLLEVRPSNAKAFRVYRHIGFEQVGLRKRYYPAANQEREDAIVMRLTL